MTDHVLTHANYDSAFQCAKDGTCPQRGDEKGCPMWVEFKARDGEDGSVRKVSGCAPVVLLQATIESIVASNISTNSVQAARDEAAKEHDSRMEGMRALSGDLDWLRKAVTYVGSRLESGKPRGLKRLLGGGQ